MWNELHTCRSWEYLEENNLLSPYQYGFRRHRSTQHAVIKFVDHILDTVNHADKLPFYGILDDELSWLSNYLFNRSQVVVYNGVTSNPEYITYGVPQGSILGPLLVNDLQFELEKCHLIMYADDTVIYYSDKNTPEIQAVINHEAERVQRWVAENCLVLNLKKGKTEFVLYGSRLSNQPPCEIKINSVELNHPVSYKYLGVILDNHLNCNSHFDRVYKRISSRIALLRRIRFSISPTVANSIYTAMINPLFLYCYPIFSGINTTWSLKFQRLKNKSNAIVNLTSPWPTVETQ